MIRALSGLVSGGVDLLEAEGRLARVHLMRIAALAAILIGCALIGTFAVLAVAAGIVVLIADATGVGPALIYVGLGALLVGIVITTWSITSMRSED